MQGENFMEYKYFETQETPRHKMNKHCRILACLMFSVTYWWHTLSAGKLWCMYLMKSVQIRPTD